MIWIAIFLAAVSTALTIVRWKLTKPKTLDVGQLDHRQEARYRENQKSYAQVRGGFRIVVLATLGVSVFCVVLSFFTTIDAGHVGVPVILGKVQETYIPEGLHTKNPFAAVHTMSVRTVSYTMTAAVEDEGGRTEDATRSLTADKMYVPIDASILYRLIPPMAPWVYRNFGPLYESAILRPNSRTAIRDGLSEFEFDEIVEDRESVGVRMGQILTGRVTGILAKYEEDVPMDPFEIQVLLRDIVPPKKVREGVEKKIEALLAAEAMVYVLDKERDEKKRKGIEAQGIETFWNTVGPYKELALKWEGIKATREIAESENAKVVIMSNDELPVILGGM